MTFCNRILKSRRVEMMRISKLFHRFSSARPKRPVA
jgi:hypothetical protein